jgi:hypothetical protein
VRVTGKVELGDGLAHAGIARVIVVVEGDDGAGDE